ncbi:MAG: phosphatase PAP2 family protein [Bacteroidetes bacterium]|nr:phosphatase PAP2 family protein [Bacteroidota bacterium]
MLEQLLHLDQDVFQVINGQWNNAFLDLVLPWMRNKYNWIPAYILLAVVLVYRYKAKGVLAIFALIACVALTDTLSHRVIKKQVERPRPCKTLDPESGEIRLLINCGSGYSFTSNHASNHFGIAAFLFFLFGSVLPGWRWLLFIWAGIIAWAQVYVGVHYPLDVLAGALLGTIIGWLCAWLFSKYGRFRPVKKHV